MIRSLLRKALLRGLDALDGKMQCIDCGCQIHKRERWVVLAARHKDCLDTRQVGQMNIEGA